LERFIRFIDTCMLGDWFIDMSTPLVHRQPEHQQLEETIVLILLGFAGAGKSTFFKQCFPRGHPTRRQAISATKRAIAANLVDVSIHFCVTLFHACFSQCSVRLKAQYLPEFGRYTEKDSELVFLIRIPWIHSL
jgi:septin family protein